LQQREHLTPIRPCYSAPADPYSAPAKQRVSLEITPEIEHWVLQNIAAARACVDRPEAGVGPLG
jgi:hypothetical protein